MSPPQRRREESVVLLDRRERRTERELPIARGALAVGKLDEACSELLKSQLACVMPS